MIYLFDGGSGEARQYHVFADKVVKHIKGKWQSTPDITENDIVLAATRLKIPHGGIVVRLLGISGNKPLVRQVLIQKGIPTINTWFNEQEAIMPFVARPASHSQCRRFYIIRSTEDLKQLPRDKKLYYSEIVVPEKEYRVLVFCGEVFAATQKPLMETLEDTVKYRIQSHGRRKPVLETLPDEWQQVCTDAVRCAESDFVGLDLLIVDGKPMICELNDLPMAQLCGSRKMFISEFRKQLAKRQNQQQTK